VRDVPITGETGSMVVGHGIGQLAELGRDMPDAALGLERKPECDETVRRFESERRAKPSVCDVDCASLTILFLLRKLDGSSRERDGDGDGEG
jgi:hypothetical protein